MNHVLRNEDCQRPELRSVRECIDSSFESLDCCLMPHPGLFVSTNVEFDGRWSRLELDFKNILTTIIPTLLKPTNLVIKKINNTHLTCSELKKHVEGFLSIFASEEIPAVQSIYELMVDKQMKILIEQCVAKYKETIVGNQDIVSENTISIFHEMGQRNATDLFRNTRKMGTTTHEQRYYNLLDEMLMRNYQEWSNISLLNLKQIAQEKRLVEQAIEERREAEREASEAAINAQNRLLELERQKAQNRINQERYEADRQVNEARLEAEQERARATKAQYDLEMLQRKEAEERIKVLELQTKQITLREINEK